MKPNRSMRTETPSENTEAGILARLLHTRRHHLSGEAARYLLSLQFDENDVSRMNELSELARSGQLAAPEAAELDSYIHVSNLVAVIQSNARRTLRTPEK